MFYLLIIFFVILALIYFVELYVSIVRAVSVEMGEYSAGLTLMSAVALVSRMLAFIAMPLFGFVADQYYDRLTEDVIVVAYLVVPIILCVFPMLPSLYLSLSVEMVNRAGQGDYFRTSGKEKISIGFDSFFDRQRLSGRWLGSRMHVLLVVSYVLYYMSWPAVLIAIINFPEYRLTVYAFNAYFTAFNTLLMTLFVDPVVLRYVRHSKKEAVDFLWYLVNVRQVSVVMSFSLLIIFVACN